MTDRLRAAAKAMLASVDQMLNNGEWYCATERAEALRAALAEQEAEPVAWMDREGDIYPMPEKPGWAPPHTLLYAAPPRPALSERIDIRELAEQAEGTKKHVPAVWQFYDHELAKFAELIIQNAAPPRREWQSLTDAEIAEIHRTCKYDASPWPLSRAIEAAIREKNRA